MKILMPDKKRNLVFFFGFGFFLLGLLPFGCSSESVRIDIGQKAPNFTYRNLNGETREFKDLNGKVIFLRFWADWCRYCDEEMPIIDKVYQEMKDKGFTVLAVNVKQSQDKVKAYVKKLNLSFPIALDQEVEIAKQYNVRGLPMNFLVSREGIIKELLIGGISDEKMLRELLERYL